VYVLNPYGVLLSGNPCRRAYFRLTFSVITRKILQGEIALIASALSGPSALSSACVHKATTKELDAPRFLSQRVTNSGGWPNENVGVSPTTKDPVCTQKLTFFIVRSFRAPSLNLFNLPFVVKAVRLKPLWCQGALSWGRGESPHVDF
jgi:hypothetical protein